MRVYGIDWLEMFVNESPSRDYSPDGFRARGWSVKERDYGTKTMAQMFVLEDRTGHPMFEIRRLPRGLDKDAAQHIYTYGDSYVRLTNLYCYHPNPMHLMCDFLSHEDYTIKKIYRIDLYLDFIRFDTGDIPAKVARRIVNHQYAKVNQTHRRTSGEDTWTQCLDNWIAWGATGSMVSTKFYNKTKEIRDMGGHKTYIVERWRQAGMIDDVVGILSGESDVEVWRLEFSIKGSAKGWIEIKKTDSEDGQRHAIPHSPDCYMHPQGVLNAIVNLIPYYFRFRIYRPNVRKSLCKEKELFRFTKEEVEFGYRLTSESDIARVRPVNLDDDMVALRHLMRAWMKLSGTEDAPKLSQMITKLQTRIAERSRLHYDTEADDWPIF